jgi:hypothetical protein
MLRLLEVVGDDRLELGHPGQAALDQVAPAVPVGRDVDEAHDAEHALAVDDALAGADGVAGELDALVRRALGGRGHGRPPLQVALTGDVRIWVARELPLLSCGLVVGRLLCMAPARQAGDGPEPDRQGGRVSEPEGLEGPSAVCQRRGLPATARPGRGSSVW